MAIHSATSSTSAAAQLLAQAQKSNAKTEAAQAKKTDAAATQPKPEAKPKEAPKPVVNSQGQKTGQVINTSA